MAVGRRQSRSRTAGLALLDELDEPLQTTIGRLLGHMGEGRLKALAELLDEARAAPG